MTDSTTTHIPNAYDIEAQQPTWQQNLNSFCENWIFAFIIAMAIRHVALEAFRIPSASMEPMLYGDPAFMKGDYVVVDKLWCRFTGVKRWDVTVFQFPVPEIEAPHNDARPALSANGDRLDEPWWQFKLMYRNFVKRAVILPGDTFFIRNGDIHLKQPDGSFRVAQKPKNIQEAVWMDIYRHGEQEGYVPWSGNRGATVTAKGEELEFIVPQAGSVSLTQPLKNLYMKPGTFRVHPLADTSGDELMQLSMTSPVFTHKRSGRLGNAWDLENWSISRMNSADLDNNTYGTQLNSLMNEWVGDVRLQGAVKQLTGDVSWELHQGTLHTYRFVMNDHGWRVEGDGVELAKGSESVIGHDASFAHIDGQIVASIGDQEIFRREVVLLEASQQMNVSIAGQGHLTVSHMRLQRDLHYTQSGFLVDQSRSRSELNNQVAIGQQSLTADPIQVDKAFLSWRLIPQVRAQMLGKKEEQLTSREVSGRIGTGPDNAITAPSNGYLLLGDNSPHSWDGRSWGWVPVENIRGRALSVVMPPSRWRIVR